MKFHQKLNTKLWTKDNELKSDVSEKLHEIADAFIEYLDIPTDAVEDIVITGSCASYNYTQHSDIDLHLLVDFEKVHTDCPIVEGYLLSRKSEFNNNHDISIYGIPVEVYAESIDNENVHNGLYSLKNGEWLEFPKKLEPTDNDAAVKAKYLEIKQEAELCDDSEVAIALIDKIKKMRKSGLEKVGEFSTENLTFKKLRDTGIIGDLMAIKKKGIDKQLSLESLNEELSDKWRYYNDYREIGINETDQIIEGILKNKNDVEYFIEIYHTIEKRNTDKHVTIDPHIVINVLEEGELIIQKTCHDTPDYIKAELKEIYELLKVDGYWLMPPDKMLQRLCVREQIEEQFLKQKSILNNCNEALDKENQEAVQQIRVLLNKHGYEINELVPHGLKKGLWYCLDNQHAIRTYDSNDMTYVQGNDYMEILKKVKNRFGESLQETLQDDVQESLSLIEEGMSHLVFDDNYTKFEKKFDKIREMKQPKAQLKRAKDLLLDIQGRLIDEQYDEYNEKVDAFIFKKNKTVSENLQVDLGEGPYGYEAYIKDGILRWICYNVDTEEIVDIFYSKEDAIDKARELNKNKSIQERFIDFQGYNFKGIVNPETGEIIYSKLSPKYKRILTSDLKFNINDKEDFNNREVIQAAKKAIQNKTESIKESFSTAKVTFDNGDVITTAINGTEEEIRDYYAIGKTFNLGQGEYDKMAKVIDVEVIANQDETIKEDINTLCDKIDTVNKELTDLMKKYNKEKDIALTEQLYNKLNTSIKEALGD